MKLLFVVVILLIGFARGQSPAKKQSVGDSAKKRQPIVVKKQRLSSYMRDVGLLYIENVERAVDVMTDLNIPSELRGERSKKQFELVKALDDRIEIHAESKADKDFYEYGLRPLGSLGEADAGTFGLALALTGLSRATGNPDDAKRAKECSRISQETIKPYIHCGTELRSIIKNGEYDLDELLDWCKFPEPKRCDLGRNPVWP